MRFLVDESTGPTVARWLQGQGHTVFSVYDEARGIDDDAVIHKAFTEDWILITNDVRTGASFYCALMTNGLLARSIRFTACWNAMPIG